jgi:hypothetical protein
MDAVYADISGIPAGKKPGFRNNIRILFLMLFYFM